MDSTEYLEHQLQAIIAKSGGEFDEPASLAFLLKVRQAELLSDSEWEKVLGGLEEAMQFITNPDASSGALLLDADPRNSNWLRIVGAWRRIGYRTPSWATLWLWWIGANREESFWSDLRTFAEEMEMERS